MGGRAAVGDGDRGVGPGALEDDLVVDELVQHLAAQGLDRGGILRDLEPLAAALVAAASVPLAALGFLAVLVLPGLLLAEALARGRGLLRGCAWAFAGGGGGDGATAFDCVVSTSARASAWAFSAAVASGSPAYWR